MLNQANKVLVLFSFILFFFIGISFFAVKINNAQAVTTCPDGQGGNYFCGDPGGCSGTADTGAMACQTSWVVTSQGCYFGECWVSYSCSSCIAQGTLIENVSCGVGNSCEYGTSGTSCSLSGGPCEYGEEYAESSPPPDDPNVAGPSPS